MLQIILKILLVSITYANTELLKNMEKDFSQKEIGVNHSLCKMYNELVRESKENEEKLLKCPFKGTEQKTLDQNSVKLEQDIEEKTQYVKKTESQIDDFQIKMVVDGYKSQ